MKIKLKLYVRGLRLNKGKQKLRLACFHDLYSRDVTCNVNKRHRSHSPVASLEKNLTRPLARKKKYFLTL